MRHLFENYKNLFDYGFDMQEEETSDSERWVYFIKIIDVKETGFTLKYVVTYSLSIDDNPSASYEDNLDYYFENIKCCLEDSEGNELFEIRPRIESLDDFDTIEYMFS